MSEPTTTIDWEARARAAEARVEELAAERARLWEELHQLRAQERAVEQAQARVRYIESTASWKLTRPLRDAKTLWVMLRRTLTRD